MEANAGEEQGRRESELPGSNWHDTYSTYFFLILAYLVMILVVSSNTTQDLLGRPSWLYQGELERNLVQSKVR